jgi:hypothetical protein
VKLVVLYKRSDVLKAVNTIYFLLRDDAVYSGTNYLQFGGAYGLKLNPEDGGSIFFSEN